MSNLIQEINNRRILPALGVYIGSSWVLIEIFDRLADRYLLSPYFTDAAFWGLYSLIPAVLLLAWAHGKPGKDRATTAEKVGVPINIIATVVLLVTMFGGKDLGATASKVTLANEEGVQETHYIPNESYRRRMVVFFFENESGNAELDWLQYGVTELLTQDLQQDPFVLASSPWANFGNGFYMRLKQAGFEDGLGAPLSLMREIATDANRQYIVSGSVNQVADEYVVTVRVWETQSLRKVAEVTLADWDLYGIIDALSVEVRNSLEIPHASARIAEDLPLAETYGESEDALRHYITGLNERLLNNDFDASNASLDAAVSEDPGFVLAWFIKAVNLIEAGDIPGAQEAISKAQELDYRLPAHDRATLKRLQYRLSGQQDKLIAFLRMQVKLRNDAASLHNLAGMLMVTGELDEAKQQFLAALDKDALSLGIYLQLSALERATGDMEAAIAYARKYQQEKPEDSYAHITLGDLLRDTGDLDGAEEHYLQASLLDNQPVQPLLRLAGIAIRKGEVNEARNLLGQAGETAQTLADKALVLQTAAKLEFRLGRIYAGIELLHQRGVYSSQYQAPFAVALETYAPMVRAYNSLGDPDRAQENFDIAMSMVSPPMNQFLAFNEADIRLQRGDLEGAEAAVLQGAAIIEQFKLEDMKFLVDMLDGFIKRKKGDAKGSAESLRATVDRIRHSVLGGSDLYQELPVFQAELARSLVEAGELEEAEKALESGFKLDPSDPGLWVSKARYQLAAGMPRLAQASVNYALAIWTDADPEYEQYIEAVELAQELERAVSK